MCRGSGYISAMSPATTALISNLDAMTNGTSAGPMIMRAHWRIYRVMALVDHKILYYIRSICLYKKL
jgi:hypothetical protein